MIHRSTFVVSGLAILALLAAPPQSATVQESRPLVYVKHLEPPLRYPPIARGARLSGTIIMKLKIDPDGTVLSVESTAGKDTRGFQILRDESEKLIRRWTFGCIGCQADGPFEHTVTFRYFLDVDPSYENSPNVVMNLPDEARITADPVPCDHCPGPSTPSKKRSY